MQRTDPPWGQALKVLRIIRRWSQHELAAAVGMTHSAISRFEGGSRRPGQEAQVWRLAAAMGFPAHVPERTVSFLRLAAAARKSYGAPGIGDPAAGLELLVGRAGHWMEEVARDAFHRALSASDVLARSAGAPRRSVAPASRAGAAAEGSEPQPTPPPMSEALSILRGMAGWSQRQLAAALVVSKETIGNYERGRTVPDARTLERLLEVMRFPPLVLEQTLSFIASARAARQNAGGTRENELRAQAESIAARAARALERFGRTFLGELAMAAQLLESRQKASSQWERLEKLPMEGRRASVRADPELRTAGLCERICEESVRAAGDSAARAVELAELAVQVAEGIGGEQEWRWRWEGYARLHLANAVKVSGYPRRAETVFERGAELWRAGAASDPGLLNEARVLQIEASLRGALRQLPEALELLDRALLIDCWGQRASLLIAKGKAMEDLGEYEKAIDLLREAAAEVDAEEPRIRFLVHLNLLVNLCHLEQHGQAELGLTQVRALVVRLGNRLDLVRVKWLEGRVAAGLQRWTDAAARLQFVRHELSRHRIAYDAALVTVELAEVYLALGRTAEVKALARESAPIFREQKVHREAQRALELFRRAAEDERASSALVRRVIVYLYRARQDPQLRFLDSAEAPKRWRRMPSRPRAS